MIMIKDHDYIYCSIPLKPNIHVKVRVMVTVPGEYSVLFFSDDDDDGNDNA